MTALVPGLAVEKGAFNDKHQLVATQVIFHGGDLKTAQDIQAGLAPTEQQVQKNQAQLTADQQKLQQQQQELQAEEAKTAANKAAIAAANKRSENWATTYFGRSHGVVWEREGDIDPQYKPQLLKWCSRPWALPDT